MTKVTVSTQDESPHGESILGSWVELHDEPCRGGLRRHQLLVNHRDKLVLRITQSEIDLLYRFELGLASGNDPDAAEFLQELRDRGFLSESQRIESLERDCQESPARDSFASTLDVRWPGADRLVRFLHDHGARHLFHPVAVIAQVALALVGLVAVIVAACSHQALRLRVHPGQIPWIIGMSLVAIAIHELAHALVVVHNDRSVDAVGMRFFLGTPSFYVESIDALLLTRKQRLIQAAAGPWAEWLVVSVTALWLWQSPVPLAIPLIHRFVILNAATIASNLLPFGGLDGSWLLADAIREPDLGQRSRGAVSRLLSNKCIGTPNSADDWALGTYSIVNTFVVGLLIATSVFFWYQLFGNLMEDLFRHGVVGWLVLVLASLVLGRPVLNSIVPRVLSGCETIRMLSNQVRFRLQWTWRTASIQRLAATIDELGQLDDSELSVLAGRLRRIRVIRSKRPSSEDYVVVHSGRGNVTTCSDAYGARVSAGTTFRPEQRITRCTVGTILVVLERRFVASPADLAIGPQRCAMNSTGTKAAVARSWVGDKM